MSKFKEDDYVIFCDEQMVGTVVKVYENKTYDVEFDEGGIGGTMTVNEDDMRLFPKPDNRTIRMTINEFDIKSKEVLENMRKEYSDITLSDMQSIAMFCKMFKESNNIMDLTKFI
jgi:hypothetical protein